MKKKPIFLLLFYIFISGAVFAQRGEVSVNPLTGAGSVAIPVISVSSGEVSAPVTLYYNGTGLKLKDVEGTAGMGWQLAAGGQISRLVRDLPDDVTFDNQNYAMHGWMGTASLDPGATYASTFVPQNNNLGSSCTAQTSDINNIDTNMGYTMDTEPDMFYVSAPGLNCQLVYDHVNGIFRTVSYQDLAISYTQVGGTGYNANIILSFTITNDKGIKYVFSNAESVTETTKLGTSGTATYFGRKFNQYKNGITYNDTWNLTSITDPYGNGIQFNYTLEPVRNSTDKLNLYLGGTSIQSPQYNTAMAVSPQRISSIRKFNAYNSGLTILTFNWQALTGTNQTGETVINSITGLGRTFNFTYANVAYAATGNKRAFLTEYSEPGCNTPVDYKFSYIGNTYTSGTNTWNTTLPDSTSAQVDYWGYYSSSATGGTLIPTVYVLNPTISTYPRYVVQATTTPGSAYTYATIGSNNRAVTASSVATGCLNQITYAAGGNTTITYESNDYLDVPSGTAVQGNGVRVKQIVDSDGSGTNNITRNYTYLDPASGLSSGKPVTLPQFAFTVPYNGTATGTALWAAATALSETDLSNDDHTIMYAYAKISQTGAGSTLFNYNVPNAYWDSGSTVELVSGYNCSTTTFGPVQNYNYTYPFIPNTNLDYLRGLPNKITSYNDGGSEVSESSYTYAQVGLAGTIKAFKSDNNGSTGLMVKGYNVYTINYNTDQLTSTVTKKIFDSSNGGNAQSSTVNYTYGSANHRLMTQQQATNSDNSTLTTNVTYSKDLTTATGTTGKPNITGYYSLQQQNINIPVESYQQVTRGGITTTVSSSLALFRDTTIGSNTLVLPSQQLKWIQSNGAAFTPISISGSTLTKDGGYFATTNYDIYDNSGYPVTVDDNNKHIATTILDHVSGRTTAVFKNAAANQVAFSDFDTDPGVSSPCKFTISGSGSYTPTGSHAGNAAGLCAVTQTATSGTLVKNTAAQSYIFSIWINASAAGTLTLAVTGVSPNPTISYSGGWQYYELKMPAASISSSFTVSFTASTSISIDDVLFYPYSAEASTATYDAAGYYKIAETNTNGVSAYYTNDQWGRLLYALDQDKNIVKRSLYVSPSNISDFVAPTISYNSTGPITTVMPVNFFASTTIDPCTWNGVLFNWTFGDGTSYQGTSSVNPQHTYTTPGTYTVNLKVSSPLFGSKSATPITVTVAQAMATVSVINHTTGAGISSITMTSSTNSYSFTSTNLPGQVVPGTYTITFQPTGQPYNSSTGKGMTNVVFSDGATGACYPWGTGGSHTFSWTVNANDALHFDIYNDNTCPFL